MDPHLILRLFFSFRGSADHNLLPPLPSASVPLDLDASIFRRSAADTHLPAGSSFFASLPTGLASSGEGSLRPLFFGPLSAPPSNPLFLSMGLSFLRGATSCLWVTGFPMRPGGSSLPVFLFPPRPVPPRRDAPCPSTSPLYQRCVLAPTRHTLFLGVVF